MRREEAKARELVYGRSNGICERCGRSRASEWHHRKNRSQGGQWTAENGLHLCVMCHAWITAEPRKTVREGGWSLRRHENPADVPVLTHEWGWVFLDADGGVIPTDEPRVA